MDLPCLPVETPTRASSSSTDPVYDNCPPFTPRGWDGDRGMEGRVLCPAVTRLPGPRSPLPGLAPAVAEVPTWIRERREAGPWPDHSYCSWRGQLGRQAWETQWEPSKAVGGATGDWRDRGNDNANHFQNPSPSSSTDNRSTLSVYDNLPDPDTPDSFQNICTMEPNFTEHMFRAWAAGPSQALTENAGEERSTWSSCQDLLTDSGFKKQDKYDPDRETGFLQEDLVLQLQLCQPQFPPQLCQTGGHEQEGQPLKEPVRVPPPVPLADPSASALRSLLTGLQQQIVRQQDEYEARIVSLEQKNAELQLEVIRLRTSLAQQRHWYQAVQAKIAESERERAAAEQRNSTLQKDMDQFLDTFGELNNEAKKTECIVRSF